MTTVAKRLKLTRAETTVLMHRLNVPDALMECLSAEENDEGYDPIEIGEVLNLLPGDLDKAMAYSKEITKAVLVDCVEGSTWIGVSSWDDNPQREAAAHKILKQLAVKVQTFFGIEKPLSVPRF